VQLNGSVLPAGTPVIWSALSGTFSDIHSLTNTYTPGINSGTITLTLAPTGSGSCAEPSTVDITVNTAPLTTDVNICKGGSGNLSTTTVCPGGSVITLGPNSGGTGANATGIGTVAWNNPGNARTNNNSYATAALTASGVTTSNYLRVSNFGFNIPASATISGIEVIIGRREDNTGNGNDVRDVEVILMKAGSTSGINNKAYTTLDWPTSKTAANYGNPTDLWGTTWNATDINAANFGVSLVANSDNKNCKC